MRTTTTLILLISIGLIPSIAADQPAAKETTLKSLIAKPKLLQKIDMEPITLKGDMLGAPVDAVLSGDEKYLAVGGKFKVIRFFDGKTGKFLARRPEPRPPLGAQRTLVWVDNRYCVASGSEHAAFVWDAQNDFRCVKAFRRSVYESLELSYNKKRRLIAMAQKMGVVSVWKFDSPAIGNEKGVTGFGDRSVAPEYMAYPIITPKAGKGSEAVKGIAWAPDGNRMAAVSVFGLDIIDSSGIHGDYEVGDKVNMHRAFWSSKLTKTAKIKKMLRIKRIPVPASDPERSLAYRVDWSADGRYIAVAYGIRKSDAHKKMNAGISAFLRIYDGKTYELLREWKPHKVRTYAVEFSPDGTVLATGGQKEAFLWDPATGEKKMTFPLHGDEVSALRWSASGKKIVSSAGSDRDDSPSTHRGNNGSFFFPGKDRLVRIWRVAE